MSQAAAFIHAHGYAGACALLTLGIVGLPVPDEWLLTFVGYLVFKGQLRLGPALATVVFGSICGISASYGLGRTLGRFFVRRCGGWIHLTEERMGRPQAWFDRTGRWSLLVGYFIPGFRHLAGVVAGTSRLRFRDFALFAYAGAFLWSVTFVAIGYFSGKEWSHATRAIHRDIVIGAVVAAGAVLAWLFFVRRSRPSG